MLEHALSIVDFSVGTDICILSSDLNLSMGKTKGYNNKILVSNTGMKIGSNKREINKDQEKLPVTPSDDDMAFGGWVNWLSFLVESKWHHYSSQSGVPW